MNIIFDYFDQSNLRQAVSDQVAIFVNWTVDEYLTEKLYAHWSDKSRKYDVLYTASVREITQVIV